MINKLSTRFLYTQDWPRVVEIDNGLWDRKHLIKTLKERWCLGIVAVDAKSKIVGFCIYSLQSPDCFTILHLVTDKDHYRTGVASKLIEKMRSKLNKKRLIICSDIAETDLPAQQFLKKMGFKSKLIRGREEDIIRFTFERIEDES